MSATTSFAEEIKTLTSKFPVEDVWLLEAHGEDFLDAPLNLIVIVSEKAEAHRLEKDMKSKLSLKPGEVDLFAFPLSAVERTPRPLMVKMALSRGCNIYRK